ncbi:ABC transporter permease subunit [Nocardioides sp.]|uniref:ABC transporter permease subunit n=1 Tax=Nocardioides sp. TaxID=35761 RepID=UPI0035127AF5
MPVAASRAGAALALLVVVGCLPWLARRDPAYTVLRSRYAEREATPEALAAVRAELGLDDGPLGALRTWLGELAHGDLGTSWVSGAAVGPSVWSATLTSLSLMGFALVVAAVVALALALPALRGAVAGRGRRGGGAAAAALTAVPEFVAGLVLLLLGAVWLRWLPPYGWEGPSSAVLPALALGLPAGGLLGGLVASAIVDAAAEPWATTWRLAGARRRTLAVALLRRSAPALVGQVALVVVGLTGGAVAVEQIFAVPGLGRLMLGAAAAQDLPTLRSSMLVLLVVAGAIGLLAQLLRRGLLAGATRGAALSAAPPEASRGRAPAARAALVLGLLALAAVIVGGLGRDPYAAVHGRLAPPSGALPFGADASGRDLLARVAHGALSTVGTGLAVTALALVVGVAAGCLPRAVVGPVEAANAAPPVLVGLVAVGLAGPSTSTAAMAVLLVAWAPLAAHAAALVEELRAQPHVAMLPALGVGRGGALVRHVLPAVVPAVGRHAALRLPGVVLALAALGFLGVGSPPPSPEWGRVLAEGAPYLERAPWAVLAPAGALMLLAVLATAAAALAPGPWTTKARPLLRPGLRGRGQVRA